MERNLMKDEAQNQNCNLLVCVPTRGPSFELTRLVKSLETALEFLANDETFGHLTVALAVCENNETTTVEINSDRFQFVSVVNEPKKGVAHVRNKLVEFSKTIPAPEFLFLVDDDETVVSCWFVELLKVQSQFNAAIVIGPTFLTYDADEPTWKKAFIDRRNRFPEQQRTCGPIGGTGNALIKYSSISDREWFDPFYSKSGGVDTDFFVRQHKQGALFAWAPKAEAYEKYAQSRMGFVGFCNRNFYEGSKTAMLIIRGVHPSYHLTKWQNLIRITKAKTKSSIVNLVTCGRKEGMVTGVAHSLFDVVWLFGFFLSWTGWRSNYYS